MTDASSSGAQATPLSSSAASSLQNPQAKPNTSTLNWVASKFSSLTHGLQKNILSNNTRASATAAVAKAALQEPARSFVATKSFDDAVKNCKEKVEKISKACRRDNRRYRDSHFDCVLDRKFCLNGLLPREFYYDSEPRPANCARVADIFEEPVFFKEGASAGDIEQGSEGDCWFLAALATATNIKGLIEKICVARDEQIGVYGFVFMRDGEWSSVIIDDQLFIQHHLQIEDNWLGMFFDRKENHYEKTFIKGSQNLYFAKCEDDNETWLPLLEKAYAKFHGDYGALSGGFSGEGAEDLTGGVTTEIFTQDILDIDRFWEEGLIKVNDEFLFAASAKNLGEYVGSDRKGIVKNHAYSVLRAVEVKEQRFLLLRNPWGKREWTGPWSDGSKEWTVEWMALLGHTFGDDGKFWMSYKDFLRKFDIVNKTRLFDDKWCVTESRWVNYKVPWSAEYADTRFEVDIKKGGPVVIVLSQLDTRFFMGLEGRFDFKLTFRVHKEGEEDYITKSVANVHMSRSVSTELVLEPGKYTVLFSAEAELQPERYNTKDIVRHHKALKPKKFKQVAMNADLAHAKAGSISFWKEADDELQQDSSETSNLPEAPPLPPPDVDTSDSDLEDEDKKPEEPKLVPPSIDSAENLAWKARVCVGLRAYSKDPDLTVEVIIPKEETNENVVDLDNPTKDLNPKDVKEVVKCICGKEPEVEEPKCICVKDKEEKKEDDINCGKGDDRKKGKEKDEGKKEKECTTGDKAEEKDGKQKDAEKKEKECTTGHKAEEKDREQKDVEGKSSKVSQEESKSKKNEKPKKIPYCPRCNPCPKHDLKRAENAKKATGSEKVKKDGAEAETEKSEEKGDSHLSGKDQKEREKEEGQRVGEEEGEESEKEEEEESEKEEGQRVGEEEEEEEEKEKEKEKEKDEEFVDASERSSEEEGQEKEVKEEAKEAQ